MELGLGLIEIGRPWGAGWKGFPSEQQVRELLRTALEEGVVFWDTASSYGSSEERVGRFLREHAGEAASRVTIATKFGDHWSPDRTESWADHSFEALVESLDRSMRLLPRIDLLQVHRATPEVLRHEDVYRALEVARSRGIRQFGASVKTIEAARIALDSGWFQWLQIPFNPLRPEMAPVFALARERGIRLIVNRPFAEGRLLYDEAGNPLCGDEVRRNAFRFVCGQPFDGYVLVGTQSPQHLRDNVRLWREAARG